MNKRIAHVVVGLPIDGHFDYFLPVRLRRQAAVGSRVEVFFGQQKKQGVIVDFAAKSKFRRLKPVIAMIDPEPLMDSHMLQLTRRLSQYYGCSWGEAIETALPDSLRKGKPLDSSLYARLNEVLKSSFVSLDEQCSLPNRRELQKSRLTLLHDASGARHWPLIVEKIKETLAKGQEVIFLVPEVVLIEGVISKLKESMIDPVAVLDKEISAKEELKTWVHLKLGEIRIVVGSRSAIFAPLKRLGLIVVYDEENPAYKQEQVPFYHVREVARMRAEEQGCSVLFVSSSPSLELWALATQKKIGMVSLPAGQMSSILAIDLTNYNPRKTSLVSFPLRNHLEKTLSRKGKVILLMNRRGFSLLTRCYSCGFTFQCQRCEVNLSYSYAQKKMVCRHCRATINVPLKCPQCGHTHLRSMGTGIEKLESEMARVFPQAKTARYDKDTKELPKDFDILMATQAILRMKGRLRVQVIGCLQIDSELNRHDLRATERAFALLVHLRQMAQDKLVVQTRLMDHYCIKAALKMDFKFFYKKEMSLRRELGFPPFKHLVAITLRGIKEETVLEQADSFYTHLGKIAAKDIDMLEPQPDMLPKLRDKYRFTIMLKGKSVPHLLKFIKEGLKDFKRKSGVIVTVNVDP